MEKTKTTNGYQFVSEDAEKAYFEGIDKIIWYKDDFAELMQMMQYGDFNKTAFDVNDLNTCFEKIEAIRDEFENLSLAIEDAFVKKGLMTKKADK